MRQLPPIIRKAYTYLFPKPFRSWFESLIAGPYPRIYDQRKFIFIHIPKTAGKSIIQLLHKGGACHLTYQEYEKYIGEKIKSYYIFTVVRNPVDRLISLYAYYLSGGNSSKESLTFKKKWISPYKDLNEFVCNALIFDEVKSNRMFLPQSAFILDSNGNLPQITIVRFEKLDDDFKKVSDHLSLKAQLPHVNVSKRKGLDTHLSKEALKVIEQIYYEDFRLLGYPFPYQDNK